MSQKARDETEAEKPPRGLWFLCSPYSTLQLQSWLVEPHEAAPPFNPPNLAHSRRRSRRIVVDRSSFFSLARHPPPPLAHSSSRDDPRALYGGSKRWIIWLTWTDNETR